MKYAIILLCIFCATLSSSCSEEVESPNQESPRPSFADKYSDVVFVENGVLHVDSCESGREFLNILPNVPIAERMAWEKSIGFRSLQSVIDSIYHEADSPFDLPATHRNYFEQIDDSSFIQKLPVGIAVFANRNGVYYLGNKVVVAKDSQVGISENGDISCAIEAITSKDSNNFFNYSTTDQGIGSLRALEVRSPNHIHDHYHNQRYWMDLDVKLEDRPSTGYGKRSLKISVDAKNFKNKSSSTRKRWREHHAITTLTSLKTEFHDASHNYGNGAFELPFPIESKTELVNFHYETEVHYTNWEAGHDSPSKPTFSTLTCNVRTEEFYTGVTINYTK